MSVNISFGWVNPTVTYYYLGIAYGKKGDLYLKQYYLEQAYKLDPSLRKWRRFYIIADTKLAHLSLKYSFISSAFKRTKVSIVKEVYKFFSKSIFNLRNGYLHICYKHICF